MAPRSSHIATTFVRGSAQRVTSSSLGGTREVSPRTATSPRDPRNSRRPLGSTPSSRPRSGVRGPALDWTHRTTGYLDTCRAGASGHLSDRRGGRKGLLHPSLRAADDGRAGQGLARVVRRPGPSGVDARLSPELLGRPLAVSGLYGRLWTAPRLQRRERQRKQRRSVWLGDGSARRAHVRHEAAGDGDGRCALGSRPPTTP